MSLQMGPAELMTGGSDVYGWEIREGWWTRYSEYILYIYGMPSEQTNQQKNKAMSLVVQAYNLSSPENRDRRSFNFRVDWATK